ncbi:hypothetical protein M2324_003509 [Rhodovulum sulfidophilum]|uniref:hypothetical protein n=1 Tax=Rhodovulum sulfidophilum TaxID=35806 RepID=UPI0012DA4CA2|nr:hypothetical protein [Rhodovulum sulfidophilum]MCW2305093.1 hypothetical protein [Rhodovulum sulfidophilum]
MAQQQISHGNCSPNIQNGSGAVIFTCPDRKNDKPIPFELFVRNLLASKVSRVNRSGNQWVDLQSAIRSDNFKKGMREWGDLLLLGGRQIQDLDGSGNIVWHIDLSGTRSMIFEANFSPQTLLTPVVEGEIMQQMKIELNNMGASLTPVACSIGLGGVWTYLIEVPGYYPSYFSHEISRGASLKVIRFSIHGKTRENWMPEQKWSEGGDDAPETAGCGGFVFSQ